jgi:hypothetical protein
MASDPKRQGRELEEIHRQFTEVGKHAGQARKVDTSGRHGDGLVGVQLPASRPLLVVRC